MERTACGKARYEKEHGVCSGNPRKCIMAREKRAGERVARNEARDIRDMYQALLNLRGQLKIWGIIPRTMENPGR